MYRKLKDVPGLVIEDSIGLFETWVAGVPTKEPGVTLILAFLMREANGHYTTCIRPVGTGPKAVSVTSVGSREDAIAFVLDFPADWPTG